MAENSINIDGNNSGNAIIGNNNQIGITDATLREILKTYQDKIYLLEEKLSNAPSQEEQLQLYRSLSKAQNELETKTQEVMKLQETLKSIQPDDAIANKAKEIFETKGINEAIEYLNGVEFQKQKDLTDKYMQETAKALKVKAEFIIIENRYEEAKTAYAQMTHYDRSFDSLFEYALFLQKQNYFKEAIQGYQNLLDLELSQANRALTLNNLANLYKAQNQHPEALQAYQEALKLYRDLAKANPSAYKPYVATTLNNLANLYKAQNQNQEALQAYQEALKLYRDLAKANPSVYNPYVANTLNNLANLYSDQNQHPEALQAYQEALKLRRELAKANPNAYEIVYAQMLIMGVDLFRQDKKDLQEAKKILEQERYKDVYQAQKFLQFIESL